MHLGYQDMREIPGLAGNTENALLWWPEKLSDLAFTPGAISATRDPNGGFALDMPIKKSL